MMYNINNILQQLLDSMKRIGHTLLNPLEGLPIPDFTYTYDDTML